MAKLYANDEGTFGEDDVVDDEKPTWDDDIDVADIIPPDTEDEDADGTSKKKKKKKKKKGGDEAMDDGGVDVDEMDADVERPPLGDDEEEWDGTEEMRKRKLEEYMDELFGLDFNDMVRSLLPLPAFLCPIVHMLICDFCGYVYVQVGGMPTRFKYTKVEQQTFGLSPAEILMATDADLNTYMGIKKYAPYRKEGKGRHWDVQRGERLKELKMKLKERGLGASGQVNGHGAEGSEKVKKRKGKKERMREKAVVAANGVNGINGEAEDDSGSDEEAPKAKGKKRRCDSEVEAVEEDNGEDDTERTTKRKRKRHHKKSGAVAS